MDLFDDRWDVGVQGPAKDSSLHEQVAVGDAIAHAPHQWPTVAEQTTAEVGVQPVQDLKTRREPHAHGVDDQLVGDVASSMVDHQIEVGERLVKDLLV